MTDILLHLAPPIAACLLYAGLGFHFWHTRWHQTHKLPPPLSMRSWERGAILLAVVLQGMSLYDGIFGASGMQFSFSYALSLMLWLAVLIYWLESYSPGMDGLQPLALPLAAICSVLPLVFPKVHVIPHANDWSFKFHFVTAMLAYSFVTLSALHAIFMGIVERKLHHGLLDKQLINLPPLLALEHILFRLIIVAFIFLTTALASGMVFSETVFGKTIAFDHKTLFAIAAWGIFAALLIGRHFYGWRGRIALRWTLTGFLLLLLAYIGSRFISEILPGHL